jgi:dihydroxyacetone kinase DhaKLM complex PTS-EIIA-like component DhaM
MGGPEIRIEPAGGAPDGSLGTDESLVRRAIADAEQGEGVVVLCDLGSAILTVRHVLDGRNGRVQLVDAPLVEGAVAAAVTSSAARPLADVAMAAEEARGARKL